MKVLLLETIAPEAVEMLSKAGFEICENYETEISPSIDLKSINGIITRGIGKVSQELIDKCPQLKTIARCGIGLNTIDVAHASSKQISVLNAPVSNAQTVADHTLALMLIIVSNLYSYIQACKENNWQFRNGYKGDELGGKKLGIIGLGNIGNKVAKLAEAFGMEVFYWSKNKKSVSYTFLELDELLKNCDLLSLHLELNEETFQILSDEALSKIKKGATIINTARAELIDNRALIEKLDKKEIQGFAADVPMATDIEVFQELMRHQNSFISPHTSSLTTQTYTRMCTEVIHNLILELAGKGANPQNIANSNALR